VLDHADLNRRLKDLRHELADAAKPWVARGILHRNTAGDVGTTIKTQAEEKGKMSTKSSPPPGNASVKRSGRWKSF